MPSLLFRHTFFLSPISIPSLRHVPDCHRSTSLSTDLIHLIVASLSDSFLPTLNTHPATCPLFTIYHHHIYRPSTHLSSLHLQPIIPSTFSLFHPPPVSHIFLNNSCLQPSAPIYFIHLSTSTLLLNFFSETLLNLISTNTNISSYHLLFALSTFQFDLFKPSSRNSNKPPHQCLLLRRSSRSRPSGSRSVQSRLQSASTRIPPHRPLIRSLRSCCK